MMKAKYIRDMTPGEEAPEEWVTVNEDGVRVIEAGTVIEHPEAFWQVLMGNATAADDECRERVASKTKPQLQAARQAMDELLELEADSLSPDDDEDNNEGEDE